MKEFILKRRGKTEKQKFKLNFHIKICGFSKLKIYFSQFQNAFPVLLELPLTTQLMKTGEMKRIDCECNMKSKLINFNVTEAPMNENDPIFSVFFCFGQFRSCE